MDGISFKQFSNFVDLTEEQLLDEEKFTAVLKKLVGDDVESPKAAAKIKALQKKRNEVQMKCIERLENDDRILDEGFFKDAVRKLVGVSDENGELTPEAKAKLQALQKIRDEKKKREQEQQQKIAQQKQANTLTAAKQAKDAAANGQQAARVADVRSAAGGRQAERDWVGSLGESILLDAEVFCESLEGVAKKIIDGRLSVSEVMNRPRNADQVEASRLLQNMAQSISVEQNWDETADFKKIERKIIQALKKKKNFDE